jgi:hypothetical protein
VDFEQRIIEDERCVICSREIEADKSRFRPPGGKIGPSYHPLCVPAEKVQREELVEVFPEDIFYE